MASTDSVADTARRQCRAELEKGIERAKKEKNDLDAFENKFVRKFNEELKEPDGEAKWKKDGANVRFNARLVGMLADFYAVNRDLETPANWKVTPGDLIKALEVVQKDCQQDRIDAFTTRRKYCEGVS